MSTEVLVALAVLIVASVLLAEIFHKLRILKVTSYARTEVSTDVMKTKKLGDLSKLYGKIVAINFPLGLAWTIFGLLLTIVLTNNQTFGIPDKNTLGSILVYWLLITLLVLVSVPIALSFNRIGLPNSLRILLGSKQLRSLAALLLVGLTTAILYNHLNLLSIILLVLMAFPATLSAWFAGEFYAVFTIRQFFIILGWDYIEGKKIPSSLLGFVKRGVAIIGFLTMLLTPIIALNSLISIFLPKEVRDSGGLVGYVTTPLIPHWIQVILIFVLIFGPLLSLALQPAGFLALTLNSDIYNTLSQFDWEEFNRRSEKLQDVINVKPYSRKVMSGVVLLFISFTVYVTILTVGSLLSSYTLPYHLQFQNLNNAIKFIEVPILLFIIWRILRDLSQEREVVDIARLGLRESRDVTGWTFWILQNLYSENYDEIDKNLDALLADELTAMNHRVHFYKGLSIALQGNNAAAEPYFKKAVELNPKYADGWFELGTVQYFQDRYDEALENLKKAQKLKSKNKTILFNLGRVYDRMDKPELALTHYKQALKLDDKDPKIWANISGPYLKLDQIDKSLEAVEKAIKLDPTDYIAKTNLATIYHQLGRNEEYLTVVDEILEARVENTNILSTMANNLAINGKYEAAQKFYTQLLDKKAINPNNIAGLSLTYTNLGQMDDLIDILETHLGQFKDDTHAKLLLGQAYQNGGNHEQALTWLKQYIAEGGNLVDGYTKLSASLANLNRLDEAEEFLGQALKKYPDDANLLFNMGLTKSLLGKTDFDPYFSKSLNISFNSHFFNIWVQSRITAGTATDQWLKDVVTQFSAASNPGEVFTTIGDAFYQQQQPDTALDYYKQALLQAVTTTQRIDIANNLLNLQQYELAVEEYQKILDKEPSVYIYNNIGVAYLRLNQLDQALDAFTKGAQLNTSDILVRQNITAILIAQKQYEEAIPVYKEILSLDEDQYISRYQFGVSLALTNNLDDAKKQLGIALQQAQQHSDQELVDKIQEMLGHIQDASQESE